jgi:hypothetical protein
MAVDCCRRLVVALYWFFDDNEHCFHHGRHSAQLDSVPWYTMTNSIINFGLTVVILILANCVALIVGSIAWVVYRPLIGISMLAGSIGLFYTASQVGKGQSGKPFTGKNAKTKF